MIHELKTAPEPFQATINEIKTFEIRKFDRDFQLSDFLILREYEPNKYFKIGGYSGMAAAFKIVYLVKPGQWGLDAFANVGVLGIQLLYTIEGNDELNSLREKLKNAN